MANLNNFFALGATTTNTQIELQPQDLCPNNYLTIVWKDVQTGKVVNTLEYNDAEAVEYTNKLNASIDNAIRNNNISYVGQNKYVNIEAIGKYLAQNIFPAGVKRSVVNALIGVVSGVGKKTPDDLINLCLNVFGTVADKTARKLGFTDPHEIFSQVAGQNVLNVIGELGNQTNSFLNKCKQKINSFVGTNIFSIAGSGNTSNTVKYAGLLLGLTTSDTESYEITIPRRKVEEGSDYTTHLLPQPWKKDFTVRLTNKILSENFDQTIEIQNIENVKNKLIEIAQSRTLFDIYIRLSDTMVYKKSNVVFSSLSFAKDEDSGNGYTATFTIEPINMFKTKVFVSDQKYKAKMRVSTSGGTGTGSKSSGTTNRAQADKSSNGDSFKYAYWKGESVLTNAKDKKELYSIVRTLQDKDYVLYSPNLNPEWKILSNSDVYPYPYKGRTVYVLMEDTKSVTKSIGINTTTWDNFKRVLKKDVSIVGVKNVQNKDFFYFIDKP